MLIHGFSGMRKEMQPLADFLNELGYNTDLLTLPGHETSPEDLRTTKWTQWIDYVQEAVDIAQKKYDKVFLSGLSLGGAITLYIAAKNPNLAGIIPISTPFSFPDKKICFFKWLPFLKRIVPPIKIKEKGWENQDALKSHQSYKYFYIESAIELEKLLTDLKNLLPLIKVPTLLIHSKKDPVVPLLQAKKILEAIASEQKSLKIIQHGGHIVTEDAGNKEAFESIRNWLQQFH